MRLHAFLFSIFHNHEKYCQGLQVEQKNNESKEYAQLDSTLLIGPILQANGWITKSTRTNTKKIQSTHNYT